MNRESLIGAVTTLVSSATSLSYLERSHEVEVLADGDLTIGRGVAVTPLVESIAGLRSSHNQDARATGVSATTRSVPCAVLAEVTLMVY